MKLQVTFTVDVDWCEEGLSPVPKSDPLASRIEDSVAEAISNALDHGMANGFSHDMEAMLSILTDSEVVVRLLD